MSNLPRGFTGNKKADFDRIFGVTEHDKKLLARLDPFIPDKVFDAHSHFCIIPHVTSGVNAFTTFGETSAKRTLEDAKDIYGERAFGALILPAPAPIYNSEPHLRDEYNEWMCGELDVDEKLIGALYVLPDDTEEKLRDMIKHERAKAFAAFFATAKGSDNPSEADFPEYLPETAWVVANERGMAISVHMGHIKGIANDNNVEYVKSMCKKYPNAKLILAHGARGFGSCNIIENAKKLSGIPNLYYDIGGICDAAAIAQMIRCAGADHVLWATDYFVDRVHARPINIGEGFTWIYSHEQPEGMEIPCCMLLLESMFALYQATILLELERVDIEKIFYRNAAELFGV